jgi:site-specific DNA-methyltransferase (adenine-specific)
MNEVVLSNAPTDRSPGEKTRAPRNRTLGLSDEDRTRLRPRLVSELRDPSRLDCTVYGDCLQLGHGIEDRAVDLLFLDPPYNLDKSFNGKRFARRSVDEYTEWLDRVLALYKPKLKATGSVYICGDWLSSASIFVVASRHFVVRNRVTWEREKGRGASANWKNASEDIWFCTVSDDYVFNLDAVRLRRRVLAPYTNGDGTPKDWQRDSAGSYRDTCPSNFWSDITVPFWSMPENTDHPTQKSEKLVAKLLLASSRPGDFVLDPFLGSGTTSVVAKKLGRHFLGIELDEEYCLLAERRLELAIENGSIQGYTDSVFWERNSQLSRSMSTPMQPSPSQE